MLKFEFFFQAEEFLEMLSLKDVSDFNVFTLIVLSRRLRDEDTIKLNDDELRALFTLNF